MSKNPNAQALASLAKGKPKTFTPADIERRRAQMKANQAKRWAGHVKKAIVLLILSTSAAAEPWKPTSTALDKPAELPGKTISGNATRLTLSGGYVIRATASSRPVVLRGVVARIGHRITARAVPGKPEMVDGIVMPGFDAIQ
jgi:hypothetical protein